MDSRYTYAVGYVRALENRLISGQMLQQLANAGDEGTFFKLLESTAYSGSTREEIERNFEEKDLGLILLAKKLMVDETLRELIGLKYDFYNLSMLLTARHSPGNTSPSLLEKGANTDPHDLRNAVEEHRMRSVPAYIRETIYMAELEFEETGRIHDISVIADREYLRTLHTKCSATGNKFFSGYSRTSSDLYNIITFFRAARMGFEPAGAKNLFTETGTIAPGIFTSSLKGGTEEMHRELGKSAYNDMFEEGLSCLRENRPFTRLEALGGVIMFKHLKKADWVVMGPEPVFKYFLTAEREITNLRLIAAGKKTRSAPESITERIFSAA